ncbi:MAG: glyoxalase superfamily protein [Sphingomicrobium sp.]
MDAKTMARRLHSAMGARGLAATHSDTLELVAAQLGHRDWNTASAVLGATDNRPTTVSSGSELARPFLPAKNFAESKSFYEALGFTKLLDTQSVAIFAMGTSNFLLQNYFQKEWAENFMMQLMVDDLDGWWTLIQSLDLPASFGVSAPKEPAVQPWGLRIAYVVDPSGILWHVAERRKGVPHD